MSFSAASLPPSTDLASTFNALLGQKGAATISGKAALDVDTLDGFLKEAYRIVSLESRGPILTGTIAYFLLLTEFAHHQSAQGTPGCQASISVDGAATKSTWSDGTRETAGSNRPRTRRC